MEKTDGPYMVECSREVRDPEVLWEISWIRQMTGPFASFDEAHTWMETIGVKSFDTLIIHILRSP
jgi:hypothetical protein